MDIQVNLHPGSNVPIVSLQGALTARAGESLEQAVRGLLPQQRLVLLDCRELTLLDSTGLGALIRCLRFALAQNCALALVDLRSAPRMVLELTRTHQLFDIYDSVDGALASLCPSGMIA
ncbi:MAG: STAS domain-containing protein [Candidatus Sericytochromatia bacterium]